MRSLETARVELSATAVLSPVPSRRAKPVTVTVPDGGAGTSAAVVSRESVCSQPRSTSTAVPPSRSSGTTTSTPGAPSRVR